MRLHSLLPTFVLATFALADESGDGLPPPGEPALDYTDGSFSEPNGGTSSYDQGNKMNISWTTSYETSNLYLIVGYEWGSPVQLATNVAQTWFQWDVDTDSTNSSEIYVFRVVNGTGTTEQQASGGFLSAAFYIHIKETSETTSSSTTSTSTLSTLMTSATDPATTSTTSNSETTPTTTATTTSSPGTGTSQGAKIGIGVGVGVGVLGLGALAAAFIFWRKSKGKQQAVAPQPYEMPLNGDFSPHYQSSQPYQTPQPYPSPQPYDPNHQSLAGYYKPPEIGETRGAELDGGQGHHFVSEVHPDNTGGRVELQ
ncbi:hypothetical protein O1611_g4053 [Lasiodiplodia mahajangana]|uniref:Uncharacterized protein n=1 Tax=Lasiodiplodia mahajangana TaxID=1108764 RepID=A0ACC2JPZ4_9PEZI|nr:hypothetical protein O1611_g4053 [Lasiodiplodia mahajangana]